MAYQKYLVPQKDLIVRHPRSKVPLLKEGELCDWTGSIGRYWRRRVNDGSVTILETPQNNRVIEKKKKENK